MKLSRTACIILLTAVIAAPLVFGQSDKSSSMFGISFSGYVKTDILSLWTEVQTNGQPWQTGVFASYYFF
jgi:hypothetical protein